MEKKEKKVFCKLKNRIFLLVIFSLLIFLCASEMISRA
jgi:hypothetical protein